MGINFLAFNYKIIDLISDIMNLFLYDYLTCSSVLVQNESSADMLCFIWNIFLSLFNLQKLSNPSELTQILLTVL